MMRSTCALLATLAMALGLTNCKHTTEQKKEQPGLRLVGRVASVPAKRGFVLIESYGSWTLPDGTYLLATGVDRKASLFTTGERLGQFVAADVKAGDVGVGDGVYFREKLKPGAKKEEPAPAAPDKAAEKTPPAASGDAVPGQGRIEVGSGIGGDMGGPAGVDVLPVTP